MNEYQKQKGLRLSVGQDGNALTMLLAINLVAFVIIAFMKVLYFFSHQDAKLAFAVFNRNFFQWITLPASFERFIHRPWTLVTHMFVHDATSIWHILGNMIWLWSFGYIFQDLSGNRRVFPVFIYGAIAGALAYMLAFNLIPALRSQLDVAQAYGASAGIMAIAIAATTLAPNYKLFTALNGGIPIWVITALYLIIDLATIPEGNPGGHIAHIAGGAMGFFFILLLKRGIDLGAWMNRAWSWVNNLFDPDRPGRKTSVKTQMFYKPGVKPFSKTATLTQQRVDEILDKIGQKGYGALTDEERELLKRAGNEDI